MFTRYVVYINITDVCSIGNIQRILISNGDTTVQLSTHGTAVSWDNQRWFFEHVYRCSAR